MAGASAGDGFLSDMRGEIHRLLRQSHERAPGEPRRAEQPRPSKRPEPGIAADLRSPPGASLASLAGQVSLSEDEFRLLRKYMPDDAALMSPIPLATQDPNRSAPTLPRPDVEIPAAVAPTPAAASAATPSAGLKGGKGRGLALRPANVSPPAALAEGRAPPTTARPATTARSSTERISAQPQPARPEAAELQQAREHVARLQQTVAERDRALQRLSAAHDDDVRRQIALQEQINKMASVRRSDEHADTLRLETSRLRETAQQREGEVGELRQELGAAQRTIATMQAERQQRRDT